MTSSGQRPLKITVSDEGASLTIKIEGTLAGCVVRELSRCWHQLRESGAPNGKELIIDLRGAVFMDDEGISALKEICREKALRFLTNSPLTQFFAARVLEINQMKGVA